MVPWRLVFAHARAQPLRWALTAGSIALAVFLYCTLQTVLAALDSLASGVSGNRLIASSAVSLFQSLPLSGVERIRAARIDGVREVGHWTWFGGVYRDPKEFFPRFGVDVETMRRQYGDLAPSGEAYLLSADDWDRFARSKGGCVVGRGLADRYALAVGDPLVLEGDIYPGTWQFEIVGVYASDNPTYDEETMFFHWSYLNEGMGRIDLVGTYTIDFAPGADAAAISAAVDDLFRNSSNRTLTQSEAAFQAQFISMWGNVGLLFGFIGASVIFATAVIALNTMLLGVRERVKEIGVLATLGFRRRSLSALFLAESFVICLGGAGLGMLLASALWHGQPLRMATVIFPAFGVPDSTLFVALGIGVGLALLAGVAPAVMASRVSIVRALREG
ncbi:MAG: ABC transporter permease [Planctomycetes bacterium]|nr:ABC transporter permease [Planctomycetota bacterium]